MANLPSCSWAGATGLGLFQQGETAIALLIVTLTMMIIPLQSRVAPLIATGRFEKQHVPDAAMAEPPPEHQSSHVIIAGFGRVGSLVADMLKEQDLPYVAVDFDVANVTRGS